MDFALQPGEAALIAGPNAAVKSSLIRRAAGLLQPAAGHIERRGRLAMSDENLALDMDKPLHRALDFWAGIDGSDSKAVGEEIGRASCRERVCQYVSISVVAVALRKKLILRHERDRVCERRAHRPQQRLALPL